MDILFPASKAPPRSNRWTMLAALLLVPPLVFWAGLLLYEMYDVQTAADVLFERLPGALRMLGMLACPAGAAVIAFAERRRAASRAAVAATWVVLVCGSALAVLAALVTIRPS